MFLTHKNRLVIKSMHLTGFENAWVSIKKDNFYFKFFISVYSYCSILYGWVTLNHCIVESVNYAKEH